MGKTAPSPVSSLGQGSRQVPIWGVSTCASVLLPPFETRFSSSVGFEWGNLRHLVSFSYGDRSRLSCLLLWLRIVFM